MPDFMGPAPASSTGTSSGGSSSAFNWKDYQLPLMAGGGTLLSELAKMLLDGGGGRKAPGKRFSGRMSPVEFAQWLAALSPDPGRMKL